MSETADWIVAYQEAFRAANPQHEENIRVQLWFPGWYRIGMPNKDFDGRKYRRSQIEEFGARLRAQVAEAGTAKQEDVE
jgi:hypothetical protein